MTIPATSENPAPSTSGANEPATSSGTASAAMIKAAEAASLPATAPAATGDTPKPGGGGPPAATPGATVQPGPEGQAAKPPASGEAPEARIEAAVRNARESTRNEVYRSLGLSAETKPEDVSTALATLKALRANPLQFLQELSGRLRPEGQGEGEEQFPEADLVSKDGTLKTYRDATIQKMLDIHGKRVIKQMMEQIGPDLDFLRSDRQSREESAAREEVRESYRDALTQARTLKHFTKENEPKILEKLKAMDPAVKKRLGPIAALNFAYGQFLDESVFPTVDRDAEARVRAANEKKVAASRGAAHPTDQGGEGVAPVIRGVDGLARHMEKLAAQQAGQ